MLLIEIKNKNSSVFSFGHLAIGKMPIKLERVQIRLAWMLPGPELQQRDWADVDFVHWTIGD